MFSFRHYNSKAFVLHISMTELETIEKQCADALQAQMVEHASRQSTESQDRKMKIGAAGMWHCVLRPMVSSE